MSVRQIWIIVLILAVCVFGVLSAQAQSEAMATFCSPSLTFRFPANWIVRQETQYGNTFELRVGSRETALSKPTTEYSSGDVLIGVIATDDPHFADETGLTGLVTKAQLAQELGTPSAIAPIISLNGYIGAQFNNDQGFLLMMHFMGEALGRVTYNARADEAETYRPEVEALLKSLRYAPVPTTPASNVYIDKNCAVHFAYPVGWNMVIEPNGDFFLAEKYNYGAFYPAPTLQSGDSVITIHIGTGKDSLDVLPTESASSTMQTENLLIGEIPVIRHSQSISAPTNEDVIVYQMRYDDNTTVTLQMATPLGEGAQQESVLRMIAESFWYVPENLPS